MSYLRFLLSSEPTSTSKLTRTLAMAKRQTLRTSDTFIAFQKYSTPYKGVLGFWGFGV